MPEFIMTMEDEGDAFLSDSGSETEAPVVIKPKKSKKTAKPAPKEPIGEINPQFSFSMSGGADDLQQKLDSVLYEKGAKAVWNFDHVKQFMGGKGARVDLDATIEATRQKRA